MHYYANHVFLRRVSPALYVDLLSFVAAVCLTWVWFAPPVSGVAYGCAALAGWLFVFLAFHFFDLYGLNVLGNGARTIRNTVSAMGAVAVALGLLYLAVPLPQGSWACAAQSAALFFPIQIVSRSVYRQLISSRRERVLILGASDLGRAIARVVAENHQLGMTLVGFLSDDEKDWDTELEGSPVFGAIHLTEKILLEEGIQRVVVASKRREEEFPADALLAAKLAGVRVESGQSFYERATGRIYMRDLRPSSLIFSDGFQMGRLQSALERILDVSVASLGLLLAAPLLMVAAIAIKLDSRGPVLFCQLRQGKDGAPFPLYKLRTMCSDAERDTGAIWASDGDPRITRVGALLRRSRLDEVPQLWNVLRGDMSVVGPRPERHEFVDSLCDQYPFFRLRSAVKPGITGWAQVRFGYVADTSAYEEKLGLDLYYVKNRSLWMDLLVLWRTVKTVLFLRGH